MKSNVTPFLAVAGLAALAFSPAHAYEGGVQYQTKPGALIGSSAGMPPPGIYMFDQIFTYQTNYRGPGVNTALGGNTKVGVQAAADFQGFVFVPGWTFLGASYDAVIVQPFEMASFGSPINAQSSGVHNTYLVPVELSWKLGTSGFAVKTGLGIWTPDGTIQGPTGLSNVGSPFWTFQPEVIVSYLANGWNLSAAVYGEFNTRSSVDDYQTGTILHADFTATKTIGKWTFGPVAYYVGQVSDDSCSSAKCLGVNPLGTLTKAQRYDTWAVGGLVEYNFGPASLSVWATQEVYSKASNAAAVAATGQDFSLATQGMTVFATISYRLWAPEEPAKAPMIHK